MNPIEWTIVIATITITIFLLAGRPPMEMSDLRRALRTLKRFHDQDTDTDRSK